RIGADRELKKALEAYWQGKISQAELEQVGQRLRRVHWRLQAEAGLDLIPTGDFAWYDQVLTMSATLGNIPVRHRPNAAQPAAETIQERPCSAHTAPATVVVPQGPCADIDLDTLFRVARGRAPSGHATTAA